MKLSSLCLSSPASERRRARLLTKHVQAVRGMLVSRCILGRPARRASLHGQSPPRPISHIPEHDKKKETMSQQSGSSRRRIKKVEEVNIQDKGRSPS